MYFFPLASNTPPFPLLCTLYNSLMTLSGELVGWALCAACEKRLPKITSRGINEKLIVLIVSVPQEFAILRKHITFELTGDRQATKPAVGRPVQRGVRRRSFYAATELYCPSGGCQSSTLLPSGSMTHPNFPSSESSVLSSTSQPSSRSALRSPARSSTR